MKEFRFKIIHESGEKTVTTIRSESLESAVDYVSSGLRKETKIKEVREVKDIADEIRKDVIEKIINDLEDDLEDMEDKGFDIESRQYKTAQNAHTLLTVISDQNTISEKTKKKIVSNYLKGKYN